MTFVNWGEDDHKSFQHEEKFLDQFFRGFFLLLKNKNINGLMDAVNQIIITQHMVTSAYNDRVKRLLRKVCNIPANFFY